MKLVNPRFLSANSNRVAFAGRQFCGEFSSIEINRTPFVRQIICRKICRKTGTFCPQHRINSPNSHVANTFSTRNFAVSTAIAKQTLRLQGRPGITDYFAARITSGPPDFGGFERSGEYIAIRGQISPQTSAQPTRHRRNGRLKSQRIPSQLC